MVFHDFKERIVAESVGSAFFEEDASATLFFRLKDDVSTRVGEDHVTNVFRAALFQRDAFEIGDELRVVAGVAAILGARVARGVYSRRAVEVIDAEAGIVGEGRQAGIWPAGFHAGCVP